VVPLAAELAGHRLDRAAVADEQDTTQASAPGPGPVYGLALDVPGKDAEDDRDRHGDDHVPPGHRHVDRVRPDRDGGGEREATAQHPLVLVVPDEEEPGVIRMVERKQQNPRERDDYREYGVRPIANTSLRTAELHLKGGECRDQADDRVDNNQSIYVS
jgi:hypothetical protein